MDGSLFNLRRLKAHTKTLEHLFRELLFADDAALIAHSEAALQRQTECFAETAKLFGLQVSLTKTEVLFQPAPKEAFHQPHIRIEDTELKSVQQFKYLGCLISSDGKIDKDIENRLAKASCAFGRLQKRAWKNKHLKKRNKDQRLQSCGPHNVALRVGVVGFLPTPPPSTGTFPPALSPHNFKHQMV